MSALSLQYPYKPNTLADDLESFIHVVTLCGLCFHRHSMTNHYYNEPKFKGLSTEEKNGKNKTLATHIHSRYDFNDTRGGVFIGGAEKLLQNKQGYPGFSFTAGEEPDEVSPHLITLVDKLYRLLKEFYESVDYSDFKKYSPKDSVKAASPSGLVRADPAVRPLLHRRRQKTRGARNSSEAPGQASRGKTPLISDVFESHERILEVFEDVIDAILDDEEDGRFWMDKTDDQFIGLLGYAEVLPKRASGSKRRSGSEHTSVADSGRASKKFRPENSSVEGAVPLAVGEQMERIAEQDHDDPFVEH